MIEHEEKAVQCLSGVKCQLDFMGFRVMPQGLGSGVLMSYASRSDSTHLGKSPQCTCGIRIKS